MNPRATLNTCSSDWTEKKQHNISIYISYYNNCNKRLPWLDEDCKIKEDKTDMKISGKSVVVIVELQRATELHVSSDPQDLF